MAKIDDNRGRETMVSHLAPIAIRPSRTYISISYNNISYKGTLHGTTNLQ